jgi:hypothetical protein
MVSPKKIHEWLLKALEEPFYQAEMHKAEILLKTGGKTSEKKRKKNKAENDHELPAGQGEKKTYVTLSGKIFSR